MAGHIDSEFEMALVIALRLTKQEARYQFGHRNTGLRDAGASAIAKSLIHQLGLSGWNIMLAPPT